MADVKTIREIAERNVKILTRKPSRGRLTGVTKARITDGVRCEIEEGPWKLAADMPVKAGGEDTAPTPGMLGRGALASCLAIGITIWAARMGIAIDALEVEVQGDFDARGELGVGEDIPPGYQEIRYIISMDSSAPPEVLADLLETAERHSPYLDVFGRAQTMERTLRVNGKAV
ncbi:MAG: OsmC family protein [Proteobacteria bacterium]|nr:OsmC family protein [Pseudomonadota bacterium]